MSSILFKFAKKLKSIRKERDLSQEKLALMCNMEKAHIGRIETMKRNAKLTTLEKIADGLGITVSELLDFDD